MSMSYVRNCYGVPAKRGMLVEAYYRRGGQWVLAKRGRISSASHWRIHVEGVAPGGEYADLGEMCGPRARYLRVKQAQWFRGWKGRTPVIVMTPVEALAAIGLGGPDE